MCKGENERINGMNDKVDISNIKLSVLEVTFNNKVNTYIATNFLICPHASSLAASKGKPTNLAF